MRFLWVAGFFTLLIGVQGCSSPVRRDYREIALLKGVEPVDVSTDPSDPHSRLSTYVLERSFKEVRAELEREFPESEWTSGELGKEGWVIARRDEITHIKDKTILISITHGNPFYENPESQTTIRIAEYKLKGAD